MLELDRVLGAAPEELEQHRAGVRIARQKRLDLIACSTERLMERMDKAAGTADAKMLLHRRSAQTIKASSRLVESSVRDFTDSFGIEHDREAVVVRRWLEAATDERDRALESGAAGVESAKDLGGQTLDRARTVTTRLAGTIAERATRQRPEAGKAGERD
ncbi:MAG: hypothetical protein HGA44_01310 [Cellulomonadaceae bacterium]|nr:hypothetical protein [Cellulomonadaceae bacterium]